MTDQIREQMSALLDGELPQDQIGLLVRRMERDTELKRAFGNYVLIGESLRAPGGITASHGFAARIQAVIGDGDIAMPAALPVRRKRWLKPAAAVAVAAGTAFAAVLLMRPGDPTGSGGVAAVADADTAANTIGDFTAADSASPTPAQSQRLAGYLVAHSQFATPIGRRNVWTSVLAQDPGITRVAYEAIEAP
jgi:sigma-E factor negative regulatory protein RseA